MTARPKPGDVGVCGDRLGHIISGGADRPSEATALCGQSGFDSTIPGIDLSGDIRALLCPTCLRIEKQRGGAQHGLRAGVDALQRVHAGGIAMTDLERNFREAAIRNGTARGVRPCHVFARDPGRSGFMLCQYCSMETPPGPPSPPMGPCRRHPDYRGEHD